jgi:hypothetical protein
MAAFKLIITIEDNGGIDVATEGKCDQLAILGALCLVKNELLNGKAGKPVGFAELADTIEGDVDESTGPN